MSSARLEMSQFVILIVTIAGLFLWQRSDAKSDHRDCVTLINAIQAEMKDFHGRLCAIESNRHS